MISPNNFMQQFLQTESAVLPLAQRGKGKSCIIRHQLQVRMYRSKKFRGIGILDKERWSRFWFLWFLRFQPCIQLSSTIVESCGGTMWYQCFSLHLYVVLTCLDMFTVHMFTICLLYVMIWITCLVLCQGPVELRWRRRRNMHFMALGATWKWSKTLLKKSKFCTFTSNSCHQMETNSASCAMKCFCAQVLLDAPWISLLSGRRRAPPGATAKAQLGSDAGRTKKEENYKINKVK